MLIAVAGLVMPVAAAAQSDGCAVDQGITRGSELSGDVHAVARVLDGETLVLGGGNKLRLIGALAPRAFDAATATSAWLPADRAKAELETMVAGKSIRLKFGGRARTDRHGRLLAQAYTIGEVPPRWVQGEMVSRGAARAYALPGHAACLPELVRRERAARAARRGLWREAGYAVRSAGDVWSLLAVEGTFQIVTGRVYSVSERRARIYINFAHDWRRDFTVTARGRVRHALSAAGLNAKALKGQTVRVRGWIERRGGPLIELNDVGEIERVEAGDGVDVATSRAAIENAIRKTPGGL